MKSPDTPLFPFRKDYAALPRLFLALGGFLGLLYAFLMPPLQVPDERAHFNRIFAISTGACMSPAAQPIPLSIDRLNTLFPPHVEFHHPIRLQDYGPLLRTRWPAGGQTPLLNPNAAIYSCAPYLASAVGVEFAKLLRQPAIVLFYCARLANLTLYLALVYLALLILPFGRPMLFCLALMPMTLHQAASVSADSPTIASAFLLFAYILYLAFDSRISSVSNRQLLLLAMLLVFTTLCKFNPWFVLLVLLIPASRFGDRRKKLLTAGILLGLVLMVSVAWQLVDRANILIFQTVKTSSGIHIADNARFVQHHPLEFLSAVAHSFKVEDRDYATQFVGNFGWISVPLPWWLVGAYLGLLLLTALSGDGRIRPSPGGRLVCACVLAGSVVSIFALLFTFETAGPCLSAEIAGQHLCVVSGVQGRYFIPLIPLLLVLLSNTHIRLNAPLITVACLGMVLISSGIAFAEIKTAFYYDNSKTARIRPGAYRNGMWIQDTDGSHQFDDSATPGRGRVVFGGLPVDIPIVGDWNGDGRRKLGIYRHGLWLLDWDGDGKFTAADRTYTSGGLDNDVPVVGDWTGNGRTKIGVYRGGRWLLDFSGDGKVAGDSDKIIAFGGLPGDIPVVGDWTGGGKSEIGIYRKGRWILDTNNNGFLDDIDAQVPDRQISFGGLPDDAPVVGDWNGDGKSKVGIVRAGDEWILDLNGDRIFSGRPYFSFGAKGYVPVVGPWAPVN